MSYLLNVFLSSSQMHLLERIKKTCKEFAGEVIDEEDTEHFHDALVIKCRFEKEYSVGNFVTQMMMQNLWIEAGPNIPKEVAT